MVLLGKKIKERRIQLHLTQTQLADKIFVSRTLITKIESGSVKLSEENLTLLEQTLGIKLH